MDDRKKDDFNNWLNQNEDTNPTVEKEEEIHRDEIVEENNSTQENNKEYNFNDIEKEEKEYITKDELEKFYHNRKPKFGFLKAVALVLVGAIFGAFVSPIANNMINKNQKVENEAGVNSQRLSITPKQEHNVENLVAEKSIPSVVGIKVVTENMRGFSIQRGEGIGSGVVVSKDGYILTNAHVVRDGAREISVLFANNKTSKAELVWKDPTLDLAILKVNEKNLTPIEFADSDKIKIGDKAIAIGNPVGLNLQSTLTSGYISGLNRSITMQDGSIMNGLIQTDASINSGNSGGALLNSEGKLIGINTAKAGQTDGIGFAIPSNVGKAIVDSIKTHGIYQPLLLGVKGIDLVNFMQYNTSFSTTAKKGVLIMEVQENSTAHNAGLQVADVLTEINGQSIESMNKLKQVLLNYKVGDEVKVKVVRDNKEIELKLKFIPEQPNI